MPLEQLHPYMRGARSALAALLARQPGLSEEVNADIEQRVAMLERFMEAAAATLRLKRQQERTEPRSAGHKS